MNEHLGLPHWAVVVLEVLERIEHDLVKLANGLNRQSNRLETIMGAVDDLNAKTAALQAAVGALGDDLGGALDRVEVDFAALKAKIDALLAGTISPADLEPAMASLDASLQGLGVIGERLRALDPDPMNPPPAA